MKVSELNINKLVIALSILRETENYLRDTTEVGKAVSGRKSLQSLATRGDTVEKLISLVRQGSEEELSAEDQELVKDLETYFSGTVEEVLTAKAIPEGEELLVLPNTYPDVNFKGTVSEFFIASTLYAIAAKTNKQEDIGQYIDYVKNLPETPRLQSMAKAARRFVAAEIDAAIDTRVATEFGDYLNVKSWKEIGNAIENLVNRVNAKDSGPSITEVTMSLDDFDRIGAAVEAMYGVTRVVVRKSARERDEVLGDRPVPHYTRANSTRKANVVLVLKSGKIDGVSFTGL